MCSWTVVEAINFFNNRNTPVFTCFLDLSKAFDLVEFAKLFRKLKNKLGKIFIRVLAFVYVFQMCCVDWAIAIGDVSKYYLCHVRNFNRTEGNIPESIDSTNFKFGTLIDTWEVDNC